MTPEERSLYELRPVALRGVLEEIASRMPAEPEELPVVTLSLRNGCEISGRIVALGVDRVREAGALLLAPLDDGPNPRYDAFYTTVPDVVAIRIHEAGRRALAERRRTAGDPPPSRLDLISKCASSRRIVRRERGPHPR
jgi:hypothetical protein